MNIDFNKLIDEYLIRKEKVIYDTNKKDEKVVLFENENENNIYEILNKIGNETLNENNEQLNEPVLNENNESLNEPVLNENNEPLNEPVLNENNEQLNEPVLNEPVLNENNEQLNESVLNESVLNEPVLNQTYSQDEFNIILNKFFNQSSYSTIEEIKDNKIPDEFHATLLKSIDLSNNQNIINLYNLTKEKYMINKKTQNEIVTEYDDYKKEHKTFDDTSEYYLKEFLKKDIPLDFDIEEEFLKILIKDNEPEKVYKPIKSKLIIQT